MPISNAALRAGLEGAEIEDVIVGAALQQGYTASNIARQAAIRAGLNVSTAAMSLDRQCASGMMAIAAASKQIINDGAQYNYRCWCRECLYGAN